MAAPDIAVRLRADDSDLQRGIKNAQSGVRSLKAALETNIRAFPGVGGQLGAIVDGLSAIRGGGAAAVLGGVAVAAVGVGVAMAAMAKKSFDNTVRVADLSERMGVASEILTAYQFGLEQSGSSLDAFATGSKKLSQAIDAANDPTSEAARLFKDLGVEVRGRDLPGVLEDLADVFQKLPEGPARTALALKLFGKAGDELIPFLTSGKSGLKAFREESEKLGLIVPNDEAKRVKLLADNIDALKSSMGGLGNEMLGKVSPALTNFTTGLREAIKNSDAWNKLAEAGILGFARRGAEILAQAKATDSLTESSKKIKGIEGEIIVQKRTLIELEKSQAKERAAAISQNIKDYEGLAGAIRTALEQSKSAEKGFRDAAAEAKGRIAARGAPENPAGGTDNSLDLTIQRMELLRLVTDGTTEELKKQAELVTTMANQLNVSNPDGDNARVKKDALNEVDNGLFRGNMRAAEEETRVQADLEVQAKANEARLAGFMAQLEELKKSAGEVEVKVEVAAAREALASLEGQLQALKESAKIRVEIERKSPHGASGSYATGGLVRGPGTDTSDNLMAWLSPREYIVRAAAVRRYGVGFLDSINQMRMPRYAAGGLVSRMPSMSTGSSRTASPENFGRLELVLPGGGSVMVQATRAAADDLSAAVRQAALQYGSRR